MNNHKRPKDTRTMVQDIFLDHPEWNARQIYDRYLILIGDPNRAVTLNAVQKHVQELTAIYDSKEFQDLEAPWQLGLTKQPEYNLSPESLKKIGDMQVFCRNSKEPPFNEPYPPITIRQALWIAKLYHYVELWAYIAKKHKKNIKKAQLWCMWQLYEWAKAYAEYERLSQLSEIPFDTTELDVHLQAGDLPIVAKISVDGKPIDHDDYRRIVFISQDNTISMYPPIKKDGETK